MASINYRSLSISAWAAIATLTIGAPALAGAAGIKNHDFLLPLAAVGLVAGVLAAPQIDRYRKVHTRQISDELDFRDGCLTDHRERPPTVGKISDCTILGVHPARLGRQIAPKRSGSLHLGALNITVQSGGPNDQATTSLVDERVPVYIPRDIDHELRERIARGEFVLLVGDSTAGKTRAAYEAIFATLSDHVLVAPQSRAAVQVAASQIQRYDRWVLWLDDLERYLGADGLTRVLLARLLSWRGHHAIVSTIRATEHARYTDPALYSEADQAARELTRDAQDVIEQARVIRISRAFTHTERVRADSRRWDPRIADALAHDRYGLAEYLAAGPELLEIWNDAWEPGNHPRGAALVAAAIDCRRAGLTRPMQRSLITKLHTDYLTAKGGANLRPESFDEAWVWATTPRRTTTSFLVPISDGAASSSAKYEVFDYLVDMAKVTSDTLDRIPDSTLRACINHADSTETDRLANTAHRTGRYQIALDAYAQARQQRDEALGPDDTSTLSCRSNSALVLHDLGRLAEAEHEHRSVFADRERLLGPDDPSTLTSRSNLTLVLHDLGRLEDAEVEYRAVLAARTRTLGPEDTSTLTARHNLARVLHDQGRLAESEAEYRAVLAVRQSVLGPDHPNTLHSHGGLARVLHDLGRLDEAETEHMTELRARTRLLRKTRPDPAHGSFGEVLQDLGRLEEAETEQAAELAALSLMPRSGNSLTLISRETFPRIMHAMIRLDEAEGAHLAELEAFALVLGPEHPNTLTSRGNHARVLHALGRVAEAEAEHRAVLEARLKILGPDHPNTLVSRNNLALALEDLGRLDEAATQHRLKLETCRSLLGPDHLNTLTSRASLATVWYAMGRLDDAAQEHEDVLHARIQSLGPDHPGTLTSRANLATVWYAMGRLDDAAREHQTVLEQEIRLLGPGHPSVQRTRDILTALRVERARDQD